MSVPLSASALQKARRYWPPVAFAVFAKIGDVFFFAGTAELHLVDVHPEVVLVAPVGRIKNSVLIEAH